MNYTKQEPKQIRKDYGMMLMRWMNEEKITR